VTHKVHVEMRAEAICISTVILGDMRYLQTIRLPLNADDTSHYKTAASHW